MSDNKRLFREMADFASVGIAVIDAAGSARYANHRLAEMTHRSQEGLLGLDLKSVLIPEDRVPARTPYKTRREGRHYRCHTDVKAGSRCIVEVVVRWMTDDHSRRTGAVAIIEDITDQVPCGHRASVGDRHPTTEANRQFTERLTRLAHMAAGIAHEFGNTLTSILTTGVGFGVVPHPSTVEDDVPAPIDFNVNDLIRATVPPIVDQETAVALSLRLSDPPTTVHMDPPQLAEALRFLTINAIEAMSRSGEITIVASHARSRHDVLPEGEFVHISVVDNGCGMSAESLEHIIEPFFTTKAGAPWGGLGLAATYGIVNQAGGRMSITSKPDAGATIHLYVPVRQHSPPQHDGIDHSRGTLLIVDDNQDLRTLATRLLADAGFEVLAAACGVDAMALLRDRTFDCLVTDIAMPDMGGIELAKSANAVDPDMPVVYVSGFVTTPWGRGGALPDDAHSLTKPYTAEALTAAVGRAIRARSLTAT